MVQSNLLIVQSVCNIYITTLKDCKDKMLNEKLQLFFFFWKPVLFMVPLVTTVITDSKQHIFTLASLK